MITILGGSFALLHLGHKELLKAAAGTGNRVVVGLTTDEYLAANKKYDLVPYEQRRRKVAEYLESLGAEYDIVPLGTRTGNSETGKEYGCIIVSPETYSRAQRINETRKGNGLDPMEILVVPYVLAEDLFPISSTRIISGEISNEGKRLKPVRIAVATTNRLKVDSTRAVFSGLMSELSVVQDSEYVQETAQPMGDEIIQLANERAMFSLKDYDYSVGIEAGLFRNRQNDTYYDVHCAVIIDRMGRVTTGFSSGFQIPDAIVHLIKRGRDLSSAVEEIYGTPSVGSKEGLVGILSGNRVIRDDLIAEAVRSALVPRITAPRHH